MKGKVIAERYQIESELGVGGMGTVFRALDKINGERVAIKQLKSEIAQPEIIERFKREGEALRELNHPNIVKILHTLEEDGQYYLVMEYVSGGDLKRLMETKQMRVEQILKLAIDLSDALTRAHKLDIIHRDLKPANVLLVEDGTLRLTDFGVAYVGRKERVTDTNAMVGTLDYMPPEAFQETPYDARGDIWSFGVMLFEMLTGQRPFAGDTFSQVLYQIINKEIPDIEALRPEAPIALVDLVYRMLERDPQARIPSVRIVGAELEAILRRPESSVHQHRFQTPVSEKIAVPHHNLPYEETAFVGREHEITEISDLICQPSNRLLTLLGQGGMGKTRLSIKVAQNQLEHFTDGAYLVELAPLSDVNAIVPALALAVGCQFQDNGREQAQQLFDFLQSKHLLIVMDNYEHLLDGTSIVSDLLRNTEKVSIIATSRQPLKVQGEAIYTLGGMDFPKTENLETVLNYSAVKLFVNRARLTRPNFEMTEDNFHDVASICRMVHGMPLGIVLAASWLSMLNPAEIVEELQQGMDILEDEVGDLPARQRSIRAVMNYSWEQMAANEREVFMKLCVFRDGFTRPAAEAVADARLRILMALSKKALLRRESDSGRYVIHELLRQYAAEHLEDSGEAKTTKSNHAAYFADLMESQVPFLKGQGQLQAITLIEAEMSNLIAAWHYATDEKNTDLIEQMLEAFTLYGLFRSWNKQVNDVFDDTRQAWDVYNNAATPIHAKLIVRFPAPDRDHAADLQHALTIAEHQDDTFEIAYCKRQLGIVYAHQRGDYGGDNTQRGIAYLNEAIQIFRDQGDLFYAALAMDDLAWSLALASRLEERLVLIDELVALRRQIGDRLGLARGANGVASSQIYSDEIIATLEEALEISLEMQDRYNLAWLSAMLGMHYRGHGAIELAEKYCLDSIELSQALNITQVLRFAQANLFAVQVVQGHDPEEIESRIDDVFPKEIENLSSQASVFFAALTAYIMVYTLMGKEAELKASLTRWYYYDFGHKYIFWILPGIAYWFAETDPETAFVYFEYALQNQEFGSRWMLHSQKHMAMYEQLKSVFTQEKQPDVWQRLQSLDRDTLITEVKALTA